MGIRICEGKEAGTEREMAVLFDSVTGWAFGPRFKSADEADSFVGFCTSQGKRPEKMAVSDLLQLHDQWLGAYSAKMAREVWFSLTVFGG